MKVPIDLHWNASNLLPCKGRHYTKYTNVSSSSERFCEFQRLYIFSIYFTLRANCALYWQYM